MTGSNPLGEYLRARRELADPADAGLRVVGVRRMPGLRREEVATLAGISADYYLRLEQGRDRNPPAQVLGALARVLGLDARATQYLLSLAATRPRAAPAASASGSPTWSAPCARIKSCGSRRRSRSSRSPASPSTARLCSSCTQWKVHGASARGGRPERPSSLASPSSTWS